MRIFAITLLMLCGFCVASDAAQAQSSCKVCSDQQRACIEKLCGPDVQDRISNVHEILREEIVKSGLSREATIRNRPEPRWRPASIRLTASCAR
jgi:hypothetical protein